MLRYDGRYRSLLLPHQAGFLLCWRVGRTSLYDNVTGHAASGDRGRGRYHSPILMGGIAVFCYVIGRAFWCRVGHASVNNNVTVHGGGWG